MDHQAYNNIRTYYSYAELEEDYLKEGLHPSDLKPALTKAIN
jgi:hypothetical protein